MNIYSKLKNIFYPLDSNLEAAYRERQLLNIETPLKIAIAATSVILWVIFFGVQRIAPDRPIFLYPAIIVQLWLIFMFATVARTDKIRTIAIYTTPLFPALVAYFFSRYIIPYLPAAASMEQGYGILSILILVFYGLETIFPLLAVLAGILTSYVIIRARLSNPALDPNGAQILLLHVIITNWVGLIMCVNLCHISRKQFKNSKKAEREREVSDGLIKRVFPESIGNELRTRGSNLARSYENVTVLFADIANFTKITTTMPPKKLVTILHDLFTNFDRLAERHGVEKIKTIGDAYMAAAGCPQSAKDHAQRVAYLALEMLKSLHSFNKRHQTRFDIRIGIHTGPLIGGVISGKRISFDIWGETVNLTSRLQNAAEPGEIIVSDETAKILRDQFIISEFHLVDFKGLGPTPVARLVSSNQTNPFDEQTSKTAKSDHVSEIAFLSQH